MRGDRGIAPPALHRQAAEVGVSPAIVSPILRRLGLNRIRDLEPAEPVRRYEREKPGEMIHIDIKKLGRFDKIGHRITGDRTGQSNGRGVGWEFVHVCIDDHSRVAFSQILPNEKAESAVPFLKAAVAYYKSLGVTVTHVMTDNGSCYKAFDFRDACRDLGIKHIRTKPYTPKTNGKAERFIQTALREWGPTRRHTPHQTVAPKNFRIGSSDITELLSVDELPHSAVIDLEATLGKFGHQPAHGKILPAPLHQPFAMRAPQSSLAYSRRSGPV
jgi:hypothetical protein